jgi:hypothetical protein
MAHTSFGIIRLSGAGRATHNCRCANLNFIADYLQFKVREEKIREIFRWDGGQGQELEAAGFLPFSL